MTAIDFSHPQNTDLATGVLAQIVAMFNHVMTGQYAGDSNIPTGAIRINPSTYDKETYNGTSWVVVDPHHPTGSMMPYAAAAASATLINNGWLLCDGAAVSRSTYAALFTALGGAASPYGTGDGSTTFNLPDMRQRFPLGKAASGTGLALGSTGGAIDHSHAITATVPGHGHSFSLSFSGTSGSQSADHYHNVSGNSAAGTSHYHTVSGGTNTVANHQHGPDAGASDYYMYGGSGGAANLATTGTHGTINANTGGAGGHGHTVSNTDPEYAHYHQVNINSGYVSAGHSHSISGTQTGSVGAAGTAGDSTMNVTLTANPTANPPFLALNFIIKT